MLVWWGRRGSSDELRQRGLTMKFCGIVKCDGSGLVVVRCGGSGGKVVRCSGSGGEKVRCSSCGGEEVRCGGSGGRVAEIHK